MDTSGRKHPSKSAEVDDYRSPKDGLEGLLPGFVAKQVLIGQSAGPTTDESENVQCDFLGSPSIILSGRFVDPVRKKCNATGAQVNAKD